MQNLTSALIVFCHWKWSVNYQIVYPTTTAKMSKYISTADETTFCSTVCRLSVLPRNRLSFLMLLMYAHVYLFISETWNDFSRQFRLWIRWCQWYDDCNSAWQIAKNGNCRMMNMDICISLVVVITFFLHFNKHYKS